MSSTTNPYISMLTLFRLLLSVSLSVWVASYTVAQGISASGTYSDKRVSDELKKGNRMVGINGFGNYRNSIAGSGGR